MRFSTLFGAVALPALAAAGSNSTTKKPNILFILTDDQDLDLGSLDFMPHVTGKIRDQGVTFENHYTTVALCCPSRAALLRGQQAHNTNITMVAAPGGGYDKFRASGEADDYLPHWMKAAGYRTEYIGKLMNQYTTLNYNYTPPGWDRFDGFVDPYTYIYNTPVFSIDGDRPIYYAAHSTDVIRAKTVNRLEALMEQDEPWILISAPMAPHQQFNDTGDFPPVPAIRHENLFPNLTAPRTPNFNPLVNKKPTWVGQLPYMDADSIAFSDDTYRRRAQALQGIDEMVEELIAKLEATGEIDNTIIVYSADHGYHCGQHRVPAGKTLPYREDTHVPFFIRGPGITPGSVTEYPSNHIDIAPTFLELAGLPKDQWPVFLDGRSLTPYYSEADPFPNGTSPEVINIEYWGTALVEATPLNITLSLKNQDYKTVRIVAKDYAYLYSVWCTNETELYDTIADPYELEPLNYTVPENARLHARLNGLLLMTKSCEQNQCRDPWQAMHPNSTVTSLADALNPIYDDYYNSLPTVQFKECINVQLPSNEAPFWGNQYIEGTSLGGAYRTPTEWLTSNPDVSVEIVDGHFGAEYEGWSVIESKGRYLTDEELETVTVQRLVRYDEDELYDSWEEARVYGRDEI